MLETVEMVRVQIRVKLQKIQCKEEKDKDLFITKTRLIKAFVRQRQKSTLHALTS